MFVAVRDKAFGHKPGEEKAYLHRTTGNIVFVTEPGNADECAVQLDEWLEIPKCSSHDHEGFIREFLAQHGIDAEFV
jgi:hypothetical protein